MNRMSTPPGSTTRYEISIRADNLPGRGGFLQNKPDPYAIITFTGGEMGDGTELGKTEILTKQKNPDWVTCFYLDVSPNAHLPFKVSVYDANAMSDFTALIAEAEFEASGVRQQPGHEQTVLCSNASCLSSKQITISVSVDGCVYGESRGNLKLHIRGLDIKNVEGGCLGLGRTDPFFEIAKKSNTDRGVVRWNCIYRSEVINDTLNPFWKEFHINLETLCNCNLDKELQISTWDFQDDGKHRLVGTFRASVNDLIQNIAIRGNADRDKAFQLKSDFDDRTDSNRNSGVGTDVAGLICILKAEIER